ncbi:hypothetical protein DSM106972_047770 [Dulcicalothrix desertica PCC 7102]|uniref:CRISPR-associated protein n=1 Tax=Dulcicalothrix desertica PCC 7102 TaxID=232991 RepID=A0A3S1CBB3_9CYAN|nr:hypothetical protein [Dulcicalothrix desertica]RUT03863.1 hypothetical protein DSM106972_047770 [Dulcicalothrix desertica PCC 7102]TWH43726.1 hypothetical protein CAL7102_07470 [Dulcicalothrix desertica PCC 7102]
MAIWLITTGSSDVQLNSNNNWGSLYSKVNEKSPIQNCDEFYAPNIDKNTKLYPVPARVLGLVYQNHVANTEFKDLSFPLLDTFFEYFNRNGIQYPDKIIFLITDQQQIFNDVEKHSYAESPYWQDTCELKPILEKYIQNKYQIKELVHPQLIFASIDPQINPVTQISSGIDNWNDTLYLVEQSLSQELAKLQYNQAEDVYVSHQAGTPAISSAVQFVSLGKFSNVSFLVSSPYYDQNYDLKYDSQLIHSSNYWRGLQIQKAKQLILNGLPGAALEILDGIDNIDESVKRRLTQLVDVFNISNSLTKGQEYEPQVAMQRIIDALELVEIFFKNKNYIQGITLLCAAQETFLKAAIIYVLYKRYPQIQLQIDGKLVKLNTDEVIIWNKKGLGFVTDDTDYNGKKYPDNRLKNLMKVHKSKNIKEEKLNILRKLQFPTDNSNNNESLKKILEKLHKGDYGNFSVIGSNTGMLAWLCYLQPNFKPLMWGLLEWVSQYEREYEDDHRNQLMHNLLGVEAEEVIKYLLGTKQNSNYQDVLTVYQEEVKKHFLKVIIHFGLFVGNSQLQQELQDIANLLK